MYIAIFFSSLLMVIIFSSSTAQGEPTLNSETVPHDGYFTIEYTLISNGDPKTWAEASADCMSRGDGWSLAAIRTQEAQDAIVSMYGWTSTAWLGGSDTDGDQQFYWHFGRFSTLDQIQTSVGRTFFDANSGGGLSSYYIHPVNGTKYEYNFVNVNFITGNGFVTMDVSGDWNQKTSTDVLSSWLCEHSPCTIAGDCEPANTISVTGNWPDCFCACKPNATGARCEIVTVDHGQYISEYQVVCGPTEQNVFYERCDVAQGWALGTVGSSAAHDHTLPMMHSSTWIAAFNVAGTTQWRTGRLTNKAFTSGRWPSVRSCISYAPAGLVNSGSGTQSFCSWASTEPSNPDGAYVAVAVPWGVWDDLGWESPFFCRLCERSPCMLALDCSPGSVAVEGYYPLCTCIAPRACVAATDCVAANTLTVSGTYPVCTCQCKADSSGPRCEYLTISHSSYTSTYVQSCSTWGNVRWTTAKLLCQARGDGWELATMPTTGSNTLLSDQVLGNDVWFGAGNTDPSAVAGTAKWIFGRLAGATFSSQLYPSATAHNLNIITPFTTHSYSGYADWGTGFPTLANNFRLQFQSSYANWRDRSNFDNATCYFCERQPCILALDCTSTASAVTGFYPHCNCTDVSTPTNSLHVSQSSSLGGLQNTRSFSLKGYSLTASLDLTQSTSLEKSTTRMPSQTQTFRPTASLNKYPTESESWFGSGSDSDSFSRPKTQSIILSKSKTLSTSEARSLSNSVDSTHSGADSTSHTFQRVSESRTLQKNSESRQGSFSLEFSISVPPFVSTSHFPTHTAQTSTQAFSSGTSQSVSVQSSPTTIVAESSTSTEEEDISTTEEQTTEEQTTTTEEEPSSQTTEFLTDLSSFTEQTTTTTPPPTELTSTSATSITTSTTFTSTQSTTTTKPSTTTNQPFTSTTTRAPIVLIPTTLSKEGFGYRYEAYNSSSRPPLIGLYSGINLLFTETFRHWHARRFLVTSIGNGQVRLSLGKDDTEGSNQSVLSLVAMSKTAREIDWLSLNGVTQSVFIDLSNRDATVEYGTKGSSLLCGDLITAAEAVVVSQTISNSVQVTLGPLAQLSQCRNAISYAGIVYSNTSYYRGPIYSYAQLSSNISSATISTFLSQMWRGSSSETFTILVDTITSVLIGSLTQPSITPAPAQQQFIRMLQPSNRSLIESIRISETTHNVVACTIADQRAFRAIRLSANESNVLQQRLGANPSGCYTFDTVDDLHLACQLSSHCAGFTTILMYTPLPRELPLCIYLTGSSAVATHETMPYSRIFYSKPQSTSAPVCSTTVEQSGRVAVYVQQTSMASGSVVLRVNGKAVAQCGGLNPFANGFLGVDGRCGQWALCYAGNVPSEANITVSSSVRLEQGGCDNSLGVLFTQTTVDSVQLTATTEAPLRRLDVTGLPYRQVHKTENDDAIKLFVYDGWTGALDVAQTGYGCLASSEATEASFCPSPSASSVVSFSTPTSCETCGGARGFLDGRAGMSDACDMYQFCGEFMPLLSTHSSAVCSSSNNSFGVPLGAFTGFVSVTANVSLLQSQFTGGDCTGFIGRVYGTRSGTKPPSHPPFFPLLSVDGSFATLHGRSLLGNLSTPIGATRLMTLLPLTEQLEVSFVPSWSAASNSTANIQASLGINSTQVCVVDHSQEMSVTCTFYIPVGATHVAVRSAQTDFATKTMQVKVLLDGSTVSATDTCGGTARFGKQVGQQERCDVFATCTSRFLYSNDSDAETNAIGKVVVTLPPMLRSYSCDYQAAIIADFTRPNVASVLCDSDTEFECPGERRCIPKEYVCDSIQDCNSEADELKCSQLLTLPEEIFCVGDNQQFTVATNSQQTCTRLAVANGSSVFWFNGTHCTFISPDLTSILLANPATYICPAPTQRTVMYLYLTERSSFGLCRSTIHCYGNGLANLGAGGVCECHCYEGFSGAMCDSSLKLELITNVACLLQNVEDTTAVSLASVAEALRIQSKVVTVMCSSLTREDQIVSGETLLRVLCSVTSTRSRASDISTHYRRLLRPSQWGTINTTLRAAGQPFLHYITGRTAMMKEIAMPSCSVAVEGQQATCPIQVIHDGLRLMISSNLSAASATVTITDVGQHPSRRSFATSAVTCNMAAITATGGCIKSSCEIPISGTANTTVTVTDVVYASPTLLTSTCSAPDIGISAHVTYGNIATTTNITVVNEEADYSPFLVSGIVVFIVGALVAWVVAVACAILFHRQLKTVLGKSLGTLQLRRYVRLKAEMLAKLSLYINVKAANAIRWDRCASAFGILGSVLAICASFLVLYYQTAYSTNSNFSVMYEEYSDVYCDRSPTGYMPRRIYAVPPGTTTCERMQSTGESAGVSFASGTCEGAEGKYTVTFRVGSSKNGCREAVTVQLPSDSCVPIALIESGSTRSVYVRLTCSSANQVAFRIKQLQELTGADDVFEVGELLEPVSRLLPLPSSEGSYYRTPYRDGTALAQSTSASNNVLVSQADPTEFDGDFDSQRIVLQQPTCSHSLVGDSSCSTFIETSLQPKMNSLRTSDIPELAPHISDVPLGHIFGGFGTSEPVTWAGAGSTAHRYYSIARGVFDMGYHFPANRDSPSDDEGYSVSLWLRADASTLGFAYAVTDAFEDVQALSVLPLERLASIIDSGSGGHTWFNTTYHVYQSLYVNGPGRTLTYAYASPAFAARVVQLEFDLIEIGAEYVMNGQWHHIAVTFIVENSKIRAQLVIDGQSSYTKAGWSVCVDTPPEPINHYPTIGNLSLIDVDGDGQRSIGAPVFNHVTNRVTSGGLLVVGYFNGGVFGLQADAKPMFNTDYLATGTQLMKDASTFPRQGTLGLGAALLGFATVLLIYLLFSSASDIRGLLSSSSEDEYRQAAETFYSTLKKIMRNTSGEKQSLESPVIAVGSPTKDQAGETQQHIRNLSIPQIVPIRFATALRWTSMNVHEFNAVRDELAAQSQDFSEALLLLILRLKLGDPCVNFSVTIWNAQVDTTLTSASEDDELDIARCGQQDLFKSAFSHSMTTTPVEPGARYESKTEKEFSDEESTLPEIELKGDMEGVTEARNLQLSGGTNSPSSTINMPSFVKLLGPMISVFQGMYVWSTSLGLPQTYNLYFMDVFAFFSVDFASAFPSVPSLITPIVQVTVGLSVLAFVVYLLLDDDRRFYSQLTRYVWRRDSLEEKEKSNVEVPQTLQSVLTANDLRPSGECSVSTLPIHSAHQLDIFRGVAKPSSSVEAAMEAINVSTSDGTTISVTRKTSPTEKKNNCALQTSSGEPIDTLGAHCLHHPSIVLTATEQNAIWPCSNRVRCCVKGCGREHGILFSCGHEYVDEDGKLSVCVFALCQSHQQLPVWEHLVMVVASKIRVFRDNGLGWFFCTVALVLVDAAYTPFMKTALMIVGCHPYYQCEFPECWAHVDQKFALAVFLAFTVIGFLGVGLPAALFILLRRRKAMMEECFLDPEHKNRYTDKLTGSLKLGEWCRFVGCDMSALAEKYKDLNPRWLFFPSLMVVLKVATLVPSIFLEPRSLNQRIGCAVVQVAATLLIFGTKAYFSPIMLLTLRAAELHQVVQLGLQNIDLVLLNDSNNSTVSIVMVSVTVVYVAFCLVVGAATVAWPVIEDKYRDRKLKRLFARFHLPFSGQTTIYVEPHVTENDEVRNGIDHTNFASPFKIGDHQSLNEVDCNIPQPLSVADLVGEFQGTCDPQGGDAVSSGADTVAAPISIGFPEQLPVPACGELKGKGGSEVSSTDFESGHYP